MFTYGYLLDLALILISTKMLGLFTKRFRMPQVVGALLAGIIMGPAILDILKETEFITQAAELGVIVLMFSAGLQTDFTELKKAGRASFIIALAGVLVPLAGGFFTAYFFGIGSDTADVSAFLKNLFIGVILTATSVSITVETLRELGKLNTRAGNAILGAALIDDVLGIIALTAITSFADKSVNVLKSLFMIVLFFVFIIVVGHIVSKLFALWVSRYQKDMRRFVIVAFAFCLVLAYISEKLFGMADITGAYFAGLIICNTQKTKYIASRFETLNYILLSPIFFASIGIEVKLPEMSFKIVAFALVLIIVAVLTKIFGSFFGAKLCGYTKSEAFQIA